MKRLFVIVPVYKAAPYLEPCLRAICSQAMPPDWVYGVFLGVDACQESLDAITTQGYLKPDGVYVFWSQDNVGSYVMRNSLVSSLPEPLSDDVLVFLDADDIVRPGILEHLLLSLERNPDVRVARYLCHAFSDVDGPHRIPEHNRGFCDGSFAIWRSTFREMGGFQPWRHAADTEFHYRLTANGHPSLYLPFVGVEYRIHAHNESKNNGEGLRLLALAEMEYAIRLEEGRHFEPVPRTVTPLEVVG